MGIFKYVYDSLFGKDYGIVWKQFSKENSGIFRFSPRGYKLVYPYGDFLITIETYTHYTSVGGNSYESEYVRGITEFASKDNFNLLITQQGLIENISKVFGAQDVQTGDRRFDKKFMIKSNDEAKTQLILSNSSITNMLLENETIRLAITDGEGLFNEKPGEGNFMFYFISESKIQHVNQLNRINTLFTNMLDALTQNATAKPVK
ncbi:hypothetical protein D3C71_637290 [compost metagenome]